MSIRYCKLTRPNIGALSAGQKITEHGISVERSRNGDLTYSINVMVDGARIHRALGKESEGVTREQAEQAVEVLRTQAREQRLNLPTGRKLHRTFAEAAETYIERMEATGGKDMTNKKRHLRTYLVPAIGKERLDRISSHRLGQYRRERTLAGAAQATINRELATFSHLMRRASSKDWGWIKRDNVPEIPKEKENRKRIQVLNPDQSSRLLDAAKNDQDDLSWLFVMFGLNAAMRHSEILRLRFDEVDFENCRIWIDKAKAGEREQPITRALRDAIKERQAKSKDKEGWIFPSRAHHARFPYKTEMRAQFARCVEAAKLDVRQCTPHVLRHTAITRLVKAGVDLPTIKRISGHKTTAMVEHYTHIHGEHIDDAIAAIEIGASLPITPELHQADSA